MFNPGIPVVHSISGYRLKDAGFIKFGSEVAKGRQVIVTTYKKGDQVITYDGVTFIYNGNPVQFMEDLK